MTSLGKEVSLFGEKNNKWPLMRSNIGYKDPQSYIYPADMDGSNYIQTPASLPLVVCCTKFRMDSQGSLPMQVRECHKQLIINNNNNNNNKFIYKTYSKTDCVIPSALNNK